MPKQGKEILNTTQRQSPIGIEHTSASQGDVELKSKSTDAYKGQERQVYNWRRRLNSFLPASPRRKKHDDLPPSMPSNVSLPEESDGNEQRQAVVVYDSHANSEEIDPGSNGILGYIGKSISNIRDNIDMRKAHARRRKGKQILNQMNY